MEISNGHHQVMATHHLQQQEKKPRPQPEQSLRCPRCDSTNTKFCYYNNYSLSQPRYFCKSCRRYWTKGGSLRNVPVGGGCRKNKRSSPSTSNSSSTPSKKLGSHHHQDINHSSLLISSMPLPPPLTYDPSDLTLAFSSFPSHDNFLLGNPNPNQNDGGVGLHSFYYGFSGGIDDVRGMVPFDGGVGNFDHASNVNSTTSTRHGSLGMESGRDYWTGVGSNSSWHGLINSSLL